MNQTLVFVQQGRRRSYRFVSVLSLNFLLKRRLLLLIFTTDFIVCMEMCAWVLEVLNDGYSILKMGTRASKISLLAVALEQPQLNPTRTEVMKSLRKTDV